MISDESDEAENESSLGIKKYHHLKIIFKELLELQARKSLLFKLISVATFFEVGSCFSSSSYKLCIVCLQLLNTRILWVLNGLFFNQTQNIK